MLRLVLVLFLLIQSLNGISHEFYFSFAEVELDELNGKVEVTIIATTHDVEKELRNEKSIIQQISGNENDSTFRSLLENKINSGFTIQLDGHQKTLRLDGIEVMLNGTTNIYLSGDLSGTINQLEVYFGFLMKTFPDQQNKMTLVYRGKKKTFVFMPNMPKQTFKLSNDNE
jgi:hypothetical protein